MKVVFETFYTEDIGYAEVRTFFEVEEKDIEKLIKMTKEEFQDFLGENAKTQITDANTPVSLEEFKNFDRIRN